MLKILLQTTISYAADDWNVTRFSRLRDEIAGLTNPDGSPAATVTARDREPDARGVDPVLATLDQSDNDQLWLIGVDTGGETGLGPDECAALTRFRKRGGAIFSTRDHQDLGSSICGLGGIGRAHYFHSTNPDPDPARNQRDDPFTTSIDYPNYHSGSNGNVQRVRPEGSLHGVLRDGARVIALLPAHPHEGSVGAPAGDPSARVVVTGTSEVTGRPFNIAVAFEADDGSGRGWAESTFHHFADYNWDIRAGCPTFVSEAPSNAIIENPALLDDAKLYVRNIVRWLSG